MALSSVTVGLKEVFLTFAFPTFNFAQNCPIRNYESADRNADNGRILSNHLRSSQKILCRKTWIYTGAGDYPVHERGRFDYIYGGFEPSQGKDQIQIRIFINDGYQILFCVPAVTKDDDMIFAVKFRHNLPDHGSCQFQVRFFFFWMFL